MPRRLSLFCLFAAWLCASGAVLDGVQVYAWGRMFMAYSHQMPVEQAAAETMDGTKPCPLCLALRHAREQSQHQQPVANVATDVARLILIAEEPAQLVFTREREPWPALAASLPTSRVDPVPLPPPRVLAAGSVI